MNKKILLILMIFVALATIVSCSELIRLFTFDYNDTVDTETEQNESYQEYERWRLKYNALVSKYEQCCTGESKEPETITAANIPQTGRNRIALVVKDVPSGSETKIKQVVGQHAAFDEALVKRIGSDLVFEKIFVKTTKGLLLDAIERLSDPTFIFKEISGDLYDLSASANVSVTVSGSGTPGCTIKIAGKEVSIDESGRWKTEIEVTEGQTEVPYEMWCDGEKVKSSTVKISSQVSQNVPSKKSFYSKMFTFADSIDYVAETEKIKQKYATLEYDYNQCCTGQSTPVIDESGYGGTRKKITVSLKGVSSGSKATVLKAISENGTFDAANAVLSNNVLTVTDVTVKTSKGALLDTIESIQEPTFIFKQLMANFYDLGASAQVTVTVSGSGTPGCTIKIKNKEVPIDGNGRWSTGIEVTQGETQVKYDMYCDGEFIKSGYVTISK